MLFIKHPLIIHTIIAIIAFATTTITGEYWIIPTWFIASMITWSAFIKMELTKMEK